MKIDEILMSLEEDKERFNRNFPIGTPVFHSDRIMTHNYFLPTIKAEIKSKAWVAEYNIFVNITNYGIPVNIVTLTPRDKYFCHNCKNWANLDQHPILKEKGRWGNLYCKDCTKPVWEAICSTLGKRSKPKIMAKSTKYTRREFNVG